MKEKLKKELSLSQIIAMAAGGMIAAWMVEIKYWFEISGSGAVFSLLTCCILVLPLCLIYSEMTSMLPYAGGENVWISNAFGWNVGWFSCWALVLLYIVAMPSVAFGISSMLSYLFPVNFIQIKMIAGGIIIIWFLLTNLEIKFLAKIQNIIKPHEPSVYFHDIGKNQIHIINKSFNLFIENDLSRFISENV